MRLALDMKSDINDVMISGITYRGDALNEKAQEVNLNLKIECERYNLFFINNSNISKQHLNRSGLHLNYKGTLALARNFLDSVKI